jgi:hypothetical protein
MSAQLEALLPASGNEADCLLCGESSVDRALMSVD